MINTVQQQDITKQIIITVTIIIDNNDQNIRILTEGSLNSQRCRLLGFITQTKLIDRLDTEHVGFSCGQTANHKPAETESHT